MNRNLCKTAKEIDRNDVGTCPGVPPSYFVHVLAAI